MSIIDVASVEELNQVQSEKSVLFFWASWHEPSKRGGQLQDIYKTLAEKYSDVKFILIEAEAVPDLSELLGVTMVPTFYSRVGSLVIDKLEGANPADLSNLVKNLYNLSGEALLSRLNEQKADPKIALHQRLEKLINAAPVMLFMKGSPAQPRCGFSRQIVEILQNNKIPFASFDILTDEEVRQGLKEYSDWPTYPQLYVKGGLVGGLDILKEMVASGNIREQLNIDEICKSYKLDDFVTKEEEEKKVDPKVALQERLKTLINTGTVMLFMKGTHTQPRCGFSSQMVEILKENNISFATFDILSDEDVRQGLKEYSDWPTYPQLYVNGSLVGGLDIVKELVATGNLKEQLGLTA
eukprot:gene3100-3298_t